MKPPLLLPSTSTPTTPFFTLTLPLHYTSPRTSSLSLNSRPLKFLTLCSSTSTFTDTSQNDYDNHGEYFQVRNPNSPPRFVAALRSRFGFGFGQQALFLLTFIASTTCVAFVGFVAAAVPTLHAMGRAANSFAKLADTTREELPSTMAAIRLSGMEISDLTVELGDLSQEISEGVNKSAQAAEAAKRGMQQIGSLAQEQTKSMIEERASLPVISLQPVVTGAAKKTSRAVGHATRTLMNLIFGAQSTSEEN